MGVIVIAWLCAVFSTIAHPISMSNGVANVRKDEILVELKVMLEDLVLFHGLKANEQTIFSADDLRKAAEKHEQFLLKHFAIRDGDGRLLKGKMDQRNDDAITDDGVPQIELMKRTIVYLMHFTPAKKNPKYLTFTQMFGGEKSIIPSIMDFMVLQSGVWTDKPVQLQPGRPHTVALDWENPPDKAPQNWRELRKKRAEEFEKRLGITSYTGLYSYIYLNDQEVRHEILVPLLTFEKWLPIERVNPEYLEVAEQEPARKKIGEWIRARNPVQIDGIPVKPVLQQLHFFGLDIKDFAKGSKPHRVSAYQARLGIILSYPAKAPPNRVRMTWDTFHDSAPFLRSIIYDRDKKPTEEFFVKDKPRFEWTRKGNPPAAHSFELNLLTPLSSSSVPVTSLLLFGAAPLLALFLYLLPATSSTSKGASLAGFCVCTIAGLYYWNPSSSPPPLDEKLITTHATALLQNVYRAYDYQNESDVYDALEHSVADNLLEDLFLEIQSSLRMREQGGAIARVKRVEVDKIALANNNQNFIDVDATWRVTGTAEHWGHIHTRENEYFARIKISTTPEGRGRITGLEVTDNKRVRFGTALRMFEDE
jgi:hypothetical protein